MPDSLIAPADLERAASRPLSEIAGLKADEALAAFGSSRAGLDAAEAERRAGIFGPNTLTQKRRKGLLKELAANLKDPLILILLFATGLSYAAGQVADGSIVLAIVLMSVALNIFQEGKAGAAVEKLKARVATTAELIRGGQPGKELPIGGIVPGDIVFLNAGDLVPADLRILSAKDFFVNQSSLTGESYPQEKTGEALNEGSEAAALRNIAFFGTNVTSGSATAMAVRTGASTEFGKIAKTLSEAEDENAFAKGVRAFSALILRTTVVFVLFVFAFNALFKQDLLQSFLFAVAVAVGLTPELLPAIMSLTMASGSIKMARKGVIVKKLSSIPSFGSMDVLCTDKTGTLTEDRIALVRYENAAGQVSDDVLLYASLNSTFQTGIQNPLDDAVVAFGKANLGGWKKVDEIPFDFFRKKLSVVAEKDGARVMTTKGAPEEVMKSCRCYHKDGACVVLNDEAEKAIRDRYAALSREGYRVLAVATKEADPAKASYEKADEADMELLGFVSFLDPARAGLPGVLLRLRELGIAVKIITGDNELVTRKVCADVGLEIEATLAGPDAETMDDADLREAVERTTVFARFSPEQKNRVIAALRENGHTVGYMGDGINDAPSLRTADIGISVSNGVDVAKEAADMVLTEKSLEELVDGVLEGRKTFGNTMKYIMMGVGSNFGNMFSVLGAVLFLPFLPMLPIQILLNNFLYDLSQVTIPGDHVDEEEIARPRAWDIGFIKRFMLVFGPLSSLFDFATFFVLARAFPGNAAAFQTGWFLESIATQTLVIHVIRTRKIPFVQSRPSLPLLFSTLAAVAVAWLLPWSPLAPYLQLVPLPGWALLAMAGIALAYLAVTEVVKQAFYRWEDGRAAR